MVLVAPTTEREITWIADMYERIGERSIPGYRRTAARLDQAKERIRARLQDKHSMVVLAQGEPSVGSAPLGMLICHLRSSPLDELPECFLDAVYVDAAARRQGIGRRLLEEAARWGRSKGARRAKTFVASGNREMLALCSAVGYTALFVELQTDLD